MATRSSAIAVTANAIGAASAVFASTHCSACAVIGTAQEHEERTEEDHDRHQRRHTLPTNFRHDAILTRATAQRMR